MPLIPLFVCTFISLNEGSCWHELFYVLQKTARIYRTPWMRLLGGELYPRCSSMESTLEAQMVTCWFYAFLFPFQYFLKIIILPMIHTWTIHEFLATDTVEAYESGELAKLLGVSTRDKADLWIKYINRIC